jgi:putative transposase
MSRLGNCWDRDIEGAIDSSPMAKAVVECFFNLLKSERIRRKKYKTRKEARRDVFDYIEFFYNPRRKHVRNGILSLIAFEQQQKLKLQGI